MFCSNTFPKKVSYLCSNILFYAESVSLFSLSESGKFKRENGLTSFASYRLVWRGVVAYFFSKAFQSPLNKNKFSAPRFLFFINLPLGADGQKLSLCFVPFIKME